jgi:hypothetical protein
MNCRRFAESVVVDDDDSDELELFWSLSSLESPEKCIKKL